MRKSVEVIYENGVFRPLEPVELCEHQRMRVPLEEEADLSPLSRVRHPRGTIPGTPRRQEKAGARPWARLPSSLQCILPHARTGLLKRPHAGASHRPASQRMM